MNKKLLLIVLCVIVLLGGFMMSRGGDAPDTGSDAGAPAADESAPAESAIGKEQLIIALDPDYESFDPGRAYEVYAQLVINAAYNTLVHFEGTLDNLTPDLAESYEVAPDAKTFTFQLNPNAKFASGNPVTAADVVWSITRVKNLRENPAFLADNIDTVTASGDHTVVITTKAPDGALLSKLTYSAFSVMDSKLAEENGASAASDAKSADTAKLWLDSRSAGSGPYVIESYTPKEQVVLARNDNYWGTPGAFEKITLRSIPDPGTQLMMLEKGDIDVAFNLGPENVKQLAGKEGIDIAEAQSLVMSFLVMNHDEAVGGPVSNPDVQKAIRLAIDYKGLQEIAGAGCSTPVSIIQTGFLGALPPLDPATAQDVARAKELMTAAGFESGFQTTLDVPTIAVEGTDLVTVAQKVQGDLKEIGIEIEIRPADMMQAFSLYRDGKSPFGLFYWAPDYPDADNQLAFVAGGAVAGPRANWPAEAAPELAALARQTSVETNSEVRAGYLGEIQTKMAEDSPFLMLLQHGRQFAVRSNVQNARYIDLYKLDLRAISKE